MSIKIPRPLVQDLSPLRDEEGNYLWENVARRFPTLKDGEQIVEEAWNMLLAFPVETLHKLYFESSYFYREDQDKNLVLFLEQRGKPVEGKILELLEANGVVLFTEKAREIAKKYNQNSLLKDIQKLLEDPTSFDDFVERFEDEDWPMLGQIFGDTVGSFAKYEEAGGDLHYLYHFSRNGAVQWHKVAALKPYFSKDSLEELLAREEEFILDYFSDNEGCIEEEMESIRTETPDCWTYEGYGYQDNGKDFLKFLYENGYREKYEELKKKILE